MVYVSSSIGSKTLKWAHVTGTSKCRVLALALIFHVFIIPSHCFEKLILDYANRVKRQK